VAVGVRVHVAPLDLLDVERKQLHAMRIHAAQIRRHQRIGYLASFGRLDSGGFEQLRGPGD